MLLHVLAHVEAQEGHSEDTCQLLGQFGLAHARGAGEEKCPHGFLVPPQARAAELDAGGHFFDGRLLAKNHRAQARVKVRQAVAVIAAETLQRHSRHFRHDHFDVFHLERFFTFAGWQ